uniref:Uncharacterized protein n=1 Tax=Opuntia streptacantha TaxID=393608 RepID=A0A7C8YZJ5_OPUST
MEKLISQEEVFLGYSYRLMMLNTTTSLCILHNHHLLCFLPILPKCSVLVILPLKPHNATPRLLQNSTSSTHPSLIRGEIGRAKNPGKAQRTKLGQKQGIRQKRMRRKRINKK